MHDPSLYKILGHPERYALLKRLMADQATLSQLGESFKKTPAHIRHHLKVLEQAGLIEFVEARPVQGGPEKYYRATQRAMFIHQAVLPEAPKEMTGITIASMDSGVNYLADQLSQVKAPVFLQPIPLSSLDGLIALRQGLCQMSTCHLIDSASEEYNRPFVRHLFPGQAIALIRVYQREEGLVVKPGNPPGVKSLEDLVRADLLFVNREPGSGVRQWLDLRLKQLDIASEIISGYTHVVHSHSDVAQVIFESKADVGIGIAASAREFGLHFIPLFEEPYEIAMPLSLITDRRYTPFFDYLNSGEFRTAIRSLDGYVVPQNSGKIEVIQ